MREAPLEHTVWRPEGRALLGHRMSPTKGHFSKTGRCNQPTRHIEIKQKVSQDKAIRKYVPNKGIRLKKQQQEQSEVEISNLPNIEYK